MARMNRKLVVAGVVAVAALVCTATQAEATWWGCYPAVSCCYTPCYATCYTPCYTTCYTSCCDPCGGWYLGYRPGPIRRLLFGPYRWYYGSGLSGCWTACCDPCCETTVDACDAAVSTGVATQQPTPAPAQTEVEAAKPAPAPAPPVATPPTVEPPASLETPAPPVAPPSTMTPVNQTSGLLTIWVPATAKVYINGLETKSTGSRRRYVSYGLDPSLTYKYEVRVELVRDGRIAEETQTVYLTAGESQGLAFGFNRQPVNGLASR